MTDITPERDPPKSYDPEENVIWTAEELKIFRKEFCSLKKENSQVSVKVQELEKYSKHLEETLSASVKGSDSMKAKLDVMKKANQRQTIQNDILKSELKTATSAIETLHQMNTSLNEERDSLLKKNSELQVWLNKERIENMRLNEHMENAKSDFTKQLISEKEKLQHIYESRIQSLMSELDATIKNYDKERDQHINTKQALQELLRHFSSLTETNGSVKIDQILTLK